MPNHFSTAEINQIRQETDGTQKVIHFNNAGAALPPNCVRDRVLRFLEEEALYGGYEMAAKYHSEIQQTYHNIAELINCQAEEVALVENATIAWNLAFTSIPLQKGEIILTTEVEYGSNFINYLKAKKDKGIEIKIIPADASGAIDVAALEAMITPAVRLISITHIPTNGGLVNPAEAIGQIAAKYGIWYLLDSCQSVGQLPMDVQKLNCTFLTGTGRKFLRGPRATGFLYASNKVIAQLRPPYLDQHSANWVAVDHYEIHPHAKRFENWESNKALRLGLSTAVRYALDIGMEKIWKQVEALAQYCRSEMAQISDVELCDRGQQQCGIVTFRLDKKDPEVVQDYLLKKGINTSVTSKPFAFIDMHQRHYESLNRASVHYYNTTEEVDRFVETLRDMA